MVRILLSTLLGERRISQAALARMTGIRPNTINELYHEMATRISFDHLDLICEALGCELTELIRVEPNAEPRTKTQKRSYPGISKRPPPLFEREGGRSNYIL